MALAARPKLPSAVTRKPVRNGPAGSEHPADVETKARARRPDARGIQLRQVNREAAEDAVVEEAQQRQQQQHVRIRARRQKRDWQHHQAADAHQRKDPPPAQAIRQRAEAEIAHQRADIEHHGRVADTAGESEASMPCKSGKRADQRRRPVRRAPQAEHRDKRQPGTGQRGAEQPGRKSSASFGGCAPPACRSSARVLTQRSGSLTHSRTNSATTAGATPTTNIGRQPWSRISRLTTAARRNPAAQADCRRPAALARLSSGQTSATSAAPAAHSPPMPSAVRKR